MALEVTTHNTVSLDGAVTGFPVDVALHYANAPASDLRLVGSRTARAGIETFLDEVPPESEADRRRPPDDAPGDLWVVPDSGGRLLGLLHALRGSEWCRDVLVLAATTTPEGYLRYLEERDYRVHVGDGGVDLAAGLRWATGEAGGGRVLADGGPGLLTALSTAGILHRISLVVAPHLAGPGGLRLFTAAAPGALEREAVAPLEGGHLRLLYRVR